VGRRGYPPHLRRKVLDLVGPCCVDGSHLEEGGLMHRRHAYEVLRY
jgi:hypothetical protein